MELVEIIATRIAACVDLPFSLDFEGAYADTPSGVMINAARIIKTGVVGVNFEDQKVRGLGLYSAEEQSARILAFREAADEAGIPLFINARTDLFLQEPDVRKHPDLINDAIGRAALYKKAGASGFFIPGLGDREQIGKICDAVDLPVNAYMKQGMPSIAEIAKLGVSRISYGPGPYRDTMIELKRRFENLT